MRSLRPVAAAYGSRVCTHLVLDELTSRRTSYAASTGTSRSAWCLPVASSGRSRSSARQALRERAWLCRRTTRVRVFCACASASSRVSMSNW